MMALFLRSVAMKQGNLHITNIDGSVVQKLPANAGDGGHEGLLPGSGRSPGGGHGNPLQYSCLENPRDRETWQATGHRLAESDTTEVTYHACRY